MNQALIESRVSLEEGIRQAFGSAGGKRVLAHEIATYIPEHSTYVEPFIGGGAVLFKKTPSKGEIINDKDSEIAFAYRYIKGVTKEKIAKLNAMDWILRRNRWTDINEGKSTHRTEEDRFFNYLYHLRGSFSDSRRSYRTSEEGNSLKPDLDHLMKVKDRIKGVAVYNRDYKELLDKYDGKDTFFYLDPPYPGEWGGKGDVIDLEELNKLLKGLKGKFILSINKSSDTRKLFSGFHFKEVQRLTSFTRPDQQKDPNHRSYDTEYLISNFPFKKEHLYEAVYPFHPEKERDDQLGEDWRIIGGWASTLKKTGKFKYTEKEIIDIFLVPLLKEIFKRGKMEFHPGNWKENSKELYLKGFKRVVKKGFNLIPPHAQMIYKGNKKAVVKSRKFIAGSFMVLVSDGKAYGFIRLKQPKAITLDGFKDLRKFHQITDEERLAWWPKENKLWYYEIRDFIPLPEPAGVRVPKGVQTFIDKVDLKEGIRPAFGSPGGKRYLAKKIISFIPEHKVYVEPFFGGGAVYFNKKQSETEVINDKSPDIAFAYRYLKGLNEKEMDKLSKLDWHCTESNFNRLKDDDPKTDTEKFHRYLLTKVWSYGLMGGTFDRDDREGQDFKGSLLSRLPKVSERLNGAKIYNKHYRTVAEEYDGKDTFFYFDPPYPGRCVKGLLGPIDMDEMREMLKKLKGKFILSLNKSPENRKMFGDFEIREVETHHQMATGGGEFRRKEFLVSNFPLRKVHLYEAEEFKADDWTLGIQREYDYKGINEQVLQSAVKKVLDQTKQSIRDDAIKLFRFFMGQKPDNAAEPNQRVTVDALVKSFKQEDFPVFSSKKYDGMRIYIFKDGDKVEIFSEDGVEIAGRLPETVKSIKGLNANKLCLDAELEMWKDGVHQPAESVTAYIYSKTEPDDTNLVANIYTCLLYEDKADLIRQGEDIRQEYLNKLDIDQSTWGIPDLSRRLNKVPNLTSRSMDELIKHMEFIRKQVASKGSIVKKSKARYYLDGNARGGWQSI